MQYTEALIARICHDLITPFNAINLGVEMLEISGDVSLIPNIAESARRANVILKFIRELFSEKHETFCYSLLSLNKMIADFFKFYDITFELKSDIENIPFIAGKIITFTVLCAKENIPFGGSIFCQIDNTKNEIIFRFRGKNISVPELEKNIDELNHKNIYRYCLMKLLRESEFELSTFRENEDIILIEKML